VTAIVIAVPTAEIYPFCSPGGSSAECISRRAIVFIESRFTIARPAGGRSERTLRRLEPRTSASAA
jgi:hypothetical protein